MNLRLKRSLAVLLPLSVGALLGWFANEMYVPNSTVDATHEEARLANSGPERAIPQTPREMDHAVDNPLRSALDAGQHGEAVQWFVDFFADSPEEANIEHAVRVLKEHVSARAAQSRGAQARALLEAILTALPEFFDARLLLAELHMQDKLYEESVNGLYAGRPHLASVADLQRLESEIERLVAISHKQLKTCCEVGRRIAFYERLVALDPSRMSYYLALAQAYVDDGQLSAARSTLAVVLHDPQVSAQARTLLASLERNTARGTKIPLQRVGNQYFVAAVFNERTELVLLLDTGASMTVLSAAAFAALQADATSLGERPLATANGVVMASIFRIQSLAVGSHQVKGLEIAVVEELDEGGVVGLLGMDYLDNFDYAIDRQEDGLYLM